MTPLILVTSDRREIEDYAWHGAVDTYLKALTWAGTVPVMVPSLGEMLDVDALLSRADGLLLTGARANVHPRRYGVEPSPRYEPYDEARDETVFAMVPRAIELGVPLFAICRGFQELNVILGGSLITEAQERPNVLDHRAPPDKHIDERYGLAHDVNFDRESRLAEIIGAPCVKVNSYHRQVIDRLAPGLVVEARAADGTIEAVRVEGARNFAFGVQWHPEYWAASDAPSGALFSAFAEAAERRAAMRLPMAAE
jgi:putative glutamine amidotransferase